MVKYVVQLSVDAKEFVPLIKQQPLPQQQHPSFHHQHQGGGSGGGGYPQPQMAMHQPSQVHQRFAMAQGGVEPGGGGDGGGGYDYGAMAHHQQQQLPGNSNGGGMMMANGSDVSAVQNRLSNMQIVDGGGDNGKEISYRQTEALDYLTEVIAELFDNPGIFDEVKKKLPNRLGDLYQDHYVLSTTIETIFDQSIRESNFRYMGARLCQLLDSINKAPNLMLRELLQLKMDHQNSELPEFMKQEQVKVRGATLFLAELYMQLRQPEEPFGKTISEYIVSAIEILVAKKGPENLKCVCQCLKLCGFELDQDCPDKVDQIMKNLDQARSSVPSAAEKIIGSVIELRKIAWGRSEEISTPSAALPPMPVSVGAMGPGGPIGAGEYQNNPVFYGPDGQVLTEEESSFLETNVKNKAQAQQAFSGYDDDDEYGLVDPDDDPEVQQAFVEFLQSNPQNRQPQHPYRPDV
uniref:MIF4G domain-containing protein n=1 Tax=Anopheles quadriannulatus TaxID=34691 RepID=A0A182WX68_ANOQN